MKIVSFVGVLSIITFLWNQDKGENGTIQLSILNEQVQIDSIKKEFIVRVRMTNSSSKTFLMYGFKEVEEAFPDESIYTQSDITVGNVFFVLDANGDYISPKMPVSPEDSDYQPVTVDTIYKVIKETGNTLEKNQIILKSEKAIEFDLKIKFKYHTLSPGAYAVYLIYYCGENITNLIDEEKIKADQKKNRAILFRGYVKSNSIQLIVQ